MALLTPQQVMAKYHYKKSKFYDDRQKCMASDYSDAVILMGKRKTLIDEDRWQEWIEYNSEQAKLKYFGID